MRITAQKLRLRVLDELLRDTVHDYNIDQLIKIVNQRIEGSNIGRETILKDITYLRQEMGMEIETKGRPAYRYRYKNVNQPCKQLARFSEDEHSLISHAIELLSGFKSPQHKWATVFLSMIKNSEDVTDVKSCIEFQNNNELKGLERFGDLLRACVNKEPLNIVYKPFDEKERTFEVSPYFLKQYNNRWYLICNDERYDYYPNIALDRIVNVTANPQLRYRRFPGNTSNYFHNVIGVTKHSDTVEVVLRVAESRIDYIKTKPFIEGQRISPQNEDKTYDVKFRIEFDTEHPELNKEITQTLLSFGDDIEVIKPIELREEMRRIIQAMISKYS